MADTSVFPPTEPQDDYLRQTEHRAVVQPGQPRVSYEAAGDEVASTVPTAAVPPQASQPDINQYAPPDTVPPPNSNTSTFVPPVSSNGTNQGYFPGMSKPIAENYILEWEAPSRPFKKRTRQYFSSVLIIGLLISLILFFAGQVLPIAVVVAAVFLVYVLSVIPPGMVRHSITTYGLRVENKLYYWEEIGRFWFTQKYGEDLLHFEIASFPGRLTLLLGGLSKENMSALLSEILILEQPKPTLYERGAAWLFPISIMILGVVIITLSNYFSL